MKPIFLILSIAILLSIMTGCVEDKDDKTDVYSNSSSLLTEDCDENKDIANPTEIKKQSTSEDVPPFPKGGQGGFTVVNHMKQNIVSEKQIEKNKSSSRGGKKREDFSADKFRSFQAEYQVIAENNLFRPLGWQKEILKEIPPKTETVVVVEIPQERPAPTYNLTLTGIAQNGSQWIAIVEDETKKKGYFLNRGEKLKDALVSEIFAEYIILAVGDTKTQLSLGESIKYDINGYLLLNTIANQKPDFLTPNSELRIPNSGEDAQKSLIERMKAKRQKELGQK